jgi:hypothetical protein
MFVAGAALAFLSEVFGTFRTMMDGNVVGSILGLAFVVGTVFFVHRLYTGRKDVRTPALGWVVVQCLIALIGTILILARHRRGSIWAERVAVPSEYLGTFKFVAYGIFGYLITCRNPALFFLRHRGGEAVETPTAAAPIEEVAPSGIVMNLTPAEKDRIAPLARTLTWVGLVLLLAGFFAAVASGMHLANLKPSSTGTRMWLQALPLWLHIVEGGAMLLLGVTFLMPARSVRNVVEQGADQNYLADSLEKLRVLSFAQVVLVSAILVLTIGNAIIQAIL